MEFQTEINKIRERIVNRTLFTTVVFVLIALIPSILRIQEIGWQPAILSHIGGSVIVIVLFTFKKHISLKLKTHILFVVVLLISVAGFLNFRIASGVQLIFPIATISVLIYGLGVGLMYSILFILLLIIAAYLNVRNIIFTNLDFNLFTNDPRSWLTQISGYAFSLIIIIDSTVLYYKFFIEHIKNTIKKTVELEDINKELQKTEKRYRSLFEGSVDGIILVDKSFKIYDCNKSFLDLVGYELSELVGRDYRNGLPKSDMDWNDYFFNKTGQIGLNKISEIKTRHKNGVFIPVEAVPHMIESDSEVFLWGVIRDLRERKRMENQIFTTMIKAEEKERERYAKELHDGLGPLLSTGLIYINAMNDEEDDNIKSDYIQRAYDIIKEATTVVREISNNLSPIILNEYGIAQALRSFIEKVQQATKIDFSIIDKIPIRFSETVEFTLYRTLVELINNSIKYSRSGKIKITFKSDQESYLILFQDDGKGFDYQNAIATKSGFGLLNLENRIKKIGGKYSYITSPGNGVKVTIQLNKEYI